MPVDDAALNRPRDRHRDRRCAGDDAGEWQRSGLCADDEDQPDGHRTEGHLSQHAGDRLVANRRPPQERVLRIGLRPGGGPHMRTLPSSAQDSSRQTRKPMRTTMAHKAEHEPKVRHPAASGEPLDERTFDRELRKLQRELVIMQEYVRAKGLKVVVIFEGRDAAGKGGVIKRIAERTNPRVCRVVALPAPTEREKTQWYFQRYVPHLPADGEIVLFDRSWYNRAGVERVMGFCTESEYEEFMRSCPEFERMLVRSGIQVIKYWFSVSDEEQERRFQARANDPMRRWKLSPMDLQSRSKWVEYSRAKDEMFRYTDIKAAPWWVVEADDKRRARLNCIAHLLTQVEYEDLTPPPIMLPPRGEEHYVRPPKDEQTFVPDVYWPARARGQAPPCRPAPETKRETPSRACTSERRPWRSSLASASGSPSPSCSTSDSRSSRRQCCGSAASSSANRSAAPRLPPVGDDAIHEADRQGLPRIARSRPVSTRSIARPAPIRRGSRTVPPSISGTPHRRQSTPKTAFSSATRRSHQIASSSPPATADPRSQRSPAWTVASASGPSDRHPATLDDAILLRRPERLQVGARGERAALTVEHGNGGVGCGIEGPEGVGERRRGRSVNRVATLWTGKDDRPDRDRHARSERWAVSSHAHRGPLIAPASDGLTVQDSRERGKVRRARRPCSGTGIRLNLGGRGGARDHRADHAAREQTADRNVAERDAPLPRVVGQPLDDARTARRSRPARGH